MPHHLLPKPERPVRLTHCERSPVRTVTVTLACYIPSQAKPSEGGKDEDDEDGDDGEGRGRRDDDDRVS